MTETPGWAAPGELPTGDRSGDRDQPAPAPTPPVPPPTPGWGPSPAPLSVGQQMWGAPPAAPRPGVVPLRPLGLGEIFDASITYIRRNPRATLGLATAVAVFNGLIQVVVLGLILTNIPSVTDTSFDSSFDSSGTSASTDVAINVVQVLQLGVGLLVQLVATGMLTFVMSQAVLGRGVTARDAWTRVKPLFWRLILTSLLVGVLVVGVAFLCLVPGLLVLIAGATSVGVLLLVLGGIAAVASGVWVYTVLVLATPALILERTTVVGALQRSRALVTGSFWRVLGIVVLAGILANIISSIITIPFGLLAGIGGFLTGAEAGGVLSWALFGATLGGAVGTVVTLPFSAGVTSLLYIDRRMRREGLDLDLARAASGAAPTGAPPPPTGAQQW